MAGPVSAVTSVLSAQEQEKAAKAAAAAAEADRQRGVDMAKNMDWSPERVRDNVGVYQRSRAPVADAFLESVLTGRNPAAVQGTRFGANIAKHDAQKAFDRDYGGWDAVMARQRQVDESTPWKVEKPVSAPQLNQDYSDMPTLQAWASSTPWGNALMDERQQKKLFDLGIVVEGSGQIVSARDSDPAALRRFGLKPGENSARMLREIADAEIAKDKDAERFAKGGV